MQRKEWFDGMGYLNTGLHLTIEQANRLGSRGESIKTVKSIRNNDNKVENQLQSIKPENLRKVLREYGAWNDQELQDHEENLNRILWIAGCDISERPNDYIEV